MHSNFNIKIMSLNGNETCIMYQEHDKQVQEPIIKPNIPKVEELPKVEKIKNRRKKNV